jgi:hypothetical protein
VVAEKLLSVAADDPKLFHHHILYTRNLAFQQRQLLMNTDSRPSNHSVQTQAATP